jgi:hypothetical protein
VPSVKGVQLRIAAFGAAATAICLMVGGPGVWGVVFGVGLVMASLWTYAILFDAAIRKGNRRLALGLPFVKLAAFLALGWWAITRGAGAIDPLGVAVGVTCLPLAAVWEALATKGNR